MYKVILSFAVLVLFSLFPKLTLATVTVTSNPAKDAIFQDTPSITIEVNNDQNNFNPDLGYTFSAWNIARSESYCILGEYSKNPGSSINVTSSKITVSWNLGGCRSETGQWKFQLWSGQGTVDRNNNSIIADYDFTIQQTGGGLPTLTPLEREVQLGTKPTVLVSNARIGQSYAFWWDPSQNALAASKKNISAADLKNGILFVPLELTDGDFKAGVIRKLCMEISANDRATGLTCRFSTTFTFDNFPPSVTDIQCAILPSLTPTINDDVSLKITNAIPSTSYAGYLDKDGVTIQNIPSQTVDTTKTLILPVGQKLSRGTYLTHIYDTANAQILNPCSIGFSVGDIDASGNIKDICKETPENCTKGGGDTCNDGRGPAMKTAIGCIHTNPAEFVKDLMTFLIGIGGGLAFLMMLFGVFQMLTSAGNPETLNAGRSRLTSAVIGLLFVIFAVLLLQIIGVDILQIPGFKR